jgi:hypothetical protein
MTLEKARLTNVKNKKDVIEFMFNPKELAFEGQSEQNENPGARDQKSGKPKVSFSNIKSYSISISNILFDTYESGENVLTYISEFRKAVEFEEGQARPPIYNFSLGKGESYLEYCFVEKLRYKLTLFLPDGTPVRAVIDSLVLKQTDKSVLDLPAPKVDRKNDTPAARTKQSKSRSQSKSPRR